jgi:hypothetical protein
VKDFRRTATYGYAVRKGVPVLRLLANERSPRRLLGEGFQENHPLLLDVLCHLINEPIKQNKTVHNTLPIGIYTFVEDRRSPRFLVLIQAIANWMGAAPLLVRRHHNKNDASEDLRCQIDVISLQSRVEGTVDALAFRLPPPSTGKACGFQLQVEATSKQQLSI